MPTLLAATLQKMPQQYRYFYFTTITDNWQFYSKYFIYKFASSRVAVKKLPRGV